MGQPSKDKVYTTIFEVRYAAEKAVATLADFREIISEKIMWGLESFTKVWTESAKMEAEYQAWKAAKEAE